MPRKSSPRTPAQPAPKNTSVQTVSFVSLGCPKNLVDSEKMLGLLAQDGLLPISYDPEDASPVDAVVVNTCGFLEASKDESLAVIREAIERKNTGAVKRVVVAGCLVQRHRAALLEWAPGIDALVGVFDRDRIVDAVRGEAPAASARSAPQAASPDSPRYWIAANALAAANDRGMNTVGLTVNGADSKGIGYFEDDSARLRLTPRHYAYLRISEGCNQNCAFCTIPSIRGKMRSKHPDAITREALELILDGAVELNLIGQDTTSFGNDIGLAYDPAARTGGLPAMLRAVSDAFDRAGTDGWVRLMYAYPSNFHDDFIRALRDTPRVLPYVDMPLQHASDRMLTAMRRNTTARHQEDLVARLRDTVPSIALRTTFISGFPGETEDDHQQLLSFVERTRFDALGVFEYSPEPGTPAGTMEKNPDLAVPPEVKSRRRHEIMELQQRIAFKMQADRAAAHSRLDSAASSAPAPSASFSAAAGSASPPSPSSRVDVLIDTSLRSSSRATTGVSAGGKLYQGRTHAQAPQIDSVTYVHSRRTLHPGEIVRCALVSSDGYDLVAVPADDLDKRHSLRVL